MSAANHETTDVPARMLGTVAGAQALGRGPAPDGDFSRHDYHHPAVTRHLTVEITASEARSVQ